MTTTTKKLANMFRYVAKNKNRPKSEDIANKTSMYTTLGKVFFFNRAVAISHEIRCLSEQKASMLIQWKSLASRVTANSLFYFFTSEHYASDIYHILGVGSLISNRITNLKGLKVQ